MLAEPDLATLESFFAGADEGQGVSLMELHGLLFAFAAAPETVPFMEMFEVAWGGDPVFESEKEVRAVAGSFGALFNQINEGVLRGEPALPDGCVVRDDPMANLDADAPLSLWSRGFRRGYRYVLDDWDYWLPEDEEADLNGELTASIMILTLFASRESAERFREDLEADGTTLEKVAGSSVRLFTEAMAAYAGLGRAIHEARLQVERERPEVRDRPSTELFELLLKLPEPSWEPWIDYAAQGVAPSHEEELIEIATDLALLDLDDGSPESWAPVHAWRSLGELRSVRAVTPLLEASGEGTACEDWLAEDLPTVCAAVGRPAIDPLLGFAGDRSRDVYARMNAVAGLGRIAKRDEGAREACVAGLTKIFEGFADDDPGFNAIVMGELVDLDVRDAAPLMQAAFEAERIDPTFMGDFEDVQIELGLLTERLTPRPSMEEWRRWQPVRADPKPGRNDPCPCGSGRKYKKCCGKGKG